MRTSTIALVAACTLFLSFSGSLASAQGAVTYELQSASSFTTGCQGPSMCACPIQLVGSVIGSFELEELFPPLLPIRDFAVNNVQWTISPGSITQQTVTGSGIYHVDIITGLHLMTLDLSIDGGAIQQFTSTTYVPGGANFEDTFAINIFAQLNVCVYDGFLLEASSMIAPPPPQFTRGDCNQDATFNLADAIFLLGFLFPVGSPPALGCDDACDANDDGALNVADAVRILGTLFPQGPPVPLDAPYPDCGLDPTADMLDCATAGPNCPTLLPMTTIAEGSQSGLTDQVTIVRDIAAWQTLWAQHTSIYVTPPPAPVVDFTTDMVVAVARNFVSTGPSVEIDAVEADGAGIHVYFTTDPCNGLLPALSEPFQMVTVATTPGATIEEETVVSPCP